MVSSDVSRILRPFHSEFTLVPVFVNRAPHITAFDTALSKLRTLVADGTAHPQVRPGRHNIITYWGMPGTGKTALSKTLERRFREGTHPVARRHRLACRIDFSQASLLDLEELTLRLRGALGLCETARWPSFDVAFASYWSRKHAGRSFGDYIKDDSKLSRHVADAGLPERFENELIRALGLTDTTAFSAVGQSVFQLVSDRLARHELFSEVPVFRDVVEAPADEALVAMPTLLAWDLAKSPTASDTDVVIFVDSFERALDPPGGPPSDMERAIQRLVWLMPNALFVITTRRRLSWAERRPDVECSGPLVWPDLAQDAGTRLELVGLDDNAADAFLRQRLLIGDAQPAIPEEVRNEIVEHSEGYPLYLELSADHFDRKSGMGEPPDPAAFTATFAEIVQAAMEGLDDEERHLVRAAAMLGTFSRNLLRAVLPDTRDADIDLLLSRAFVSEDSAEPWFPYSLHTVLTDSILKHDHLTHDRWSKDEWAAAAERGLDALAELLADDIARPGSADRSRLIDGFGIGVRLTQRVSVLPDWLFEAAYALRILKLPEVLELRMFGPATTFGAARAMITICRGMARRLREDFGPAAALHRRALAFKSLTPSQVLFVQHRLAKALEAHGYYAGAERNLTDANRTGTLLPDVIVKDYVRLALLRGNPEPAIAWAGAHVESDVPTHRAQAWALLGRFRWFSGDFAGAGELFRNILTDPELARSGLSRVTGSRNVALAACWTTPEEGLRLGRLALRANAEAGERIGEAQAHVAMAIASTGRSPNAEVEVQLATATGLFEASNDEPELYFVLLARLFLACVTGDHIAAVEAEAALLAHLDRYPLVPYLREAAGAWMQRFDPHRAVGDSGARWPNRDAALVAWRTALDERVALP